MPLKESVRTFGDGLALRDVQVGERPWPSTRIRTASGPEDCIVVGDPRAEPLALVAGKLRAGGGAWRVDAAVPADARWHGAALLSRRDGMLVGLLLVYEDDGARVALIPPNWSW